MSLLPEHLADLRASGLTDATVELMRVESVDPSDRLRSKGVTSAYRMPYLQLKNCPEFYRDKLFPPIVDENGKQRKYDQPIGGGCRLYVLEPVVDLLQDFTKPIFIAEGEKKSAVGYQSGLGCIVGVGGVWNFLDKNTGQLIPEFDRIAWRNREIYYIPDSDVWARRDLQQAVFEFGAKTRERGGLFFYFIQIPPAPNGAKRGLDDFLRTESVEALMQLPKVTVTGPGWTLEKKAYKAREAKRERARKGADTESPEDKPQEEIPEDLLGKAWLTRDLIDTVVSVLRRFVFIRDERLYTLIAIWTLATYVYECFEYMAILWVTSPTKRSGKTRLLEVLVQLTSRPSGLLINATESIIFHNTDRGSTLFLDEVEKLQQKNSDLYGTIMAVLNSGFQRGATVPRMRKTKDGNFTEVQYKTYGPKVIAGIKNVTDTIADRSLVIKMIRRVRSTEKVERFRLRKLAAELGGIVLQLKIWGAAKSDMIQAIYDGIANEPDGLKHCDDRFLDIVEPLLAIAALADAEYTNGGKRVFDDLVMLLKDLGSERDEDQSGAAITVAVETIRSLLGRNDQLDIPSADLLRALEDKPATAWIKTQRALATFVGKLGLRKSPHHGERRSYCVTRAWVDDMKARYSSFSDLTKDSEVSQLSQTQPDQGPANEKYVSQEDGGDI